MSARMLAFVACMLGLGVGHAGHGLMNSFGDVEWLPDPGTTPDRLAYPLDRISERIELRLAASTDEELALCLAFAREKLAEASAMIKAVDVDAAVVAIDVYRDYIERAAAAVDQGPADLVPERRHGLIAALMEHVYIMSVDYLDMPLGIRTVISPVFTTAMDHYATQSAKLPQRAKDALFFKDEEIRWSLEMMRQADVQQITN